jgi:hypothetical protein
LSQISSAIHKNPKAIAMQAAYPVLSATEIVSTSHQYSSHEQGQQDGTLLQNNTDEIAVHFLCVKCAHYSIKMHMSNPAIQHKYTAYNPQTMKLCI